MFNNGKPIDVEGLDWLYELIPMMGNAVHVLAQGEVLDEATGYLVYRLLVDVDIDEVDAEDPALLIALAEERFIPRRLIEAINERGIILRMRRESLADYFLIQVDTGDRVMSFSPTRNGQPVDSQDPDFWFASVKNNFTGELRSYTINSRKICESLVMDLMQNLTSQLVVEVLE